MNKNNKNKQVFNITNSSGVSFGNISANIGETEKNEEEGSSGIKELRELVMGNDLKKALKEFLLLCKDEQTREEIYLIQGRLKQLGRDISANRISYETEILERNRIRSAILELLKGSE